MEVPSAPRHPGPANSVPATLCHVSSVLPTKRNVPVSSPKPVAIFEAKRTVEKSEHRQRTAFPTPKDPPAVVERFELSKLFLTSAANADDVSPEVSLP